jgi:calcium-dependent protein kinase
VTQTEREQLAEMFTCIDSDGNGVISREELVSTFKQQTGSHYS